MGKKSIWEHNTVQNKRLLSKLNRGNLQTV